MAVADVDLDLLRQERAQQTTFDDNRRWRDVDCRQLPHASRSGSIRRPTMWACDAGSSDSPSCRPTRARLEQDCYEAYNIQVSGLVQRLRATGVERAVIGVSGGLDSTHALIVIAKAMDLLGLPRTNILAYTLPGFATSDHTKGNALRLMRSLGVAFARTGHSPGGPADAERSRTSVRARRAGL